MSITKLLQKNFKGNWRYSQRYKYWEDFDSARNITMQIVQKREWKFRNRQGVNWHLTNFEYPNGREIHLVENSFKVLP